MKERPFTLASHALNQTAIALRSGHTNCERLKGQTGLNLHNIPALLVSIFFLSFLGHAPSAHARSTCEIGLFGPISPSNVGTPQTNPNGSTHPKNPVAAAWEHQFAATSFGYLRPTTQFPASPSGTLQGALVDLSPDGQFLALSTDGRGLAIRDTATGKSVAEIPGWKGALKLIRFSKDGQEIIAVSESEMTILDSQLKKKADFNNLLPNQHSTRPAVTFDFNTKRAFFPDITGGSLIAEVGNSNTKGASVFYRVEDEDSVYSVSASEFSKDGKLLLIERGKRTVRIFNVQQAAYTVGLYHETEPIVSSSLSFDNQYVLVSVPSQTSILRLSPSKKHIIPSESPVQNSRISPDSKKILIGMENGVASLMDIETGKKIYDIAPHPMKIIATSFSLDSSYFLTLSEDGLLRIWETDTGRLLQEVMTSGKINSARFGYGNSIVTTDEANLVTVWRQ